MSSPRCPNFPFSWDSSCKSHLIDKHCQLYLWALSPWWRDTGGKKSWEKGTHRHVLDFGVSWEPLAALALVSPYAEPALPEQQSQAVLALCDVPQTDLEDLELMWACIFLNLQWHFSIKCWKCFFSGLACLLSSHIRIVDAHTGKWGTLCCAPSVNGFFYQSFVQTPSQPWSLPPM